LQEIGRGAMGVVYLARQVALGGRLVAVKVLAQGLDRWPRARERFLAEARTLARFSHPNIVKVHAAVQEGGQSAVVMEWVEGSSLARIIETLAAAGSTAELR